MVAKSHARRSFRPTFCFQLTTRQAFQTRTNGVFRVGQLFACRLLKRRNCTGAVKPQNCQRVIAVLATLRVSVNTTEKVIFLCMKCKLTRLSNVFVGRLKRILGEFFSIQYYESDMECHWSWISCEEPPLRNCYSLLLSYLVINLM